MNEWEPGRPVLTARDRALWLAWRSARKRQQQVDRRARHRRIDYYASLEAAAALDRLWAPQAGRDFSSILDAIVMEWLACCHRNKQVASGDRDSFNSPKLAVRLKPARRQIDYPAQTKRKAPTRTPKPQSDCGDATKPSPTFPQRRCPSKDS